MAIVTITPQSAVSVPPPAPGDLTLFVDSADSILKTKDSGDVVRPSGVGTADELATMGSPVDVSGSPSPPIAGNYALETTSDVTAEWRPRTLPYVQTAVQVGPSFSAALNDLVRADVSAAVLTINLPTAALHTREIMVKLVTVATFACTVDAAGAETIDGALTLVMSTDFEWAILKSDGANWMQVG